MFKRILALGTIVMASGVAWLILSAAMTARTNEKSNTMTDAVGDLWGTPQSQVAPTQYLSWVVEKKPAEMTTEEVAEWRAKKQAEENVQAEKEGRSPKMVKMKLPEKIKLQHGQWIELSGSKITADLDLDYRKKGLLWFSTYKVTFNAEYTIVNPVESPVQVTMAFPFPSESAVYDNMKVIAAGREDLKYVTVAGANQPNAGRDTGRMTATFTLPPQARQVVQFTYQSRGLDQWTYRFGEKTSMITNFNLVMRTNFDEIDYPRNSIAPDKPEKNAKGPGWTLTWDKKSLVSAFQIGMVMPHRLNPGPLAATMSSHAPVSLLFFFFVIFLLQVMRGIKIHPMNYFFIAAGFFAFNLLFSYLVDHLGLIVSFLIASTASLFLCVSYLRLVVGNRFALFEAALSQFTYQVLFSFAHFYEGYTGLAVTVIAIVTLAVVMRLTAKIDWEEKFKKDDHGRKSKQILPPPMLNPEVAVESPRP